MTKIYLEDCVLKSENKKNPFNYIFSQKLNIEALRDINKINQNKIKNEI